MVVVASGYGEKWLSSYLGVGMVEFGDELDMGFWLQQLNGFHSAK